MGRLSDSLKDMGFVPTGEESPVDESGEIWTNGIEMVCDETATVIDGNHNVSEEDDKRERNNGRIVYRYRNSGRVKLCGGHVSTYNWGNDDGFRY